MKKLLVLILITLFFGLTNFVSAEDTTTRTVDDTTVTGTTVDYEDANDDEDAMDDDTMDDDTMDDEDANDDDEDANDDDDTMDDDTMDDDDDNAIERKRKVLRNTAKLKRKELKGEAKMKREELKGRLKEKRDSLKKELKEKRKDFVKNRVNTINKYKKAFNKRLKNRLDRVPDDKLELVATRIDAAITKVENSTRLSNLRKTRLLAQLVALKTIIDERLGIESEETDILNGLFDGIVD